ncbi:MAG: DPP IV N-terminal domain-containing protein [Ferruginibacter sp.]
MKFIMKELSIIILFFNISFQTEGQQKELTDEQYFNGDLKKIAGPLPTVTSWIDDSHFLLLINNKVFIVDAKTGREEESTGDTDKLKLVPVKAKAYYKKSDLYIKENDVEIQLTNDKEKEVNPVMSPDGNYVAYTKNNDLYALDILTKTANRLTTDGSDTILNGYSSWIYMEEVLGRTTEYRSFWWSPDSRHIAYFHFDDTNVPLFTLMDGAGQHGLVEKQRYPKVGDRNPAVKVGVVSPTGGATIWADFNEKDDQYFGVPFWKPDGSSLLVQWMNRKQNNLRIFDMNIENGNKVLIYTETQKTWIDLKLKNDRISFLKNGSFILFNDVTGWRHIYFYDKTGKLINAITTGKFTVTEINYIDENKGIVYFTARGLENTARKDVYKVNLNGKDLKRLTFGDFNHDNISISPGGSYFTTTYSNVSTPPRLTLLDNNGKIIKEIADSKGSDFNTYNIAKTELIRVKSDDGLYDLPMKVTWPLHFDRTKKYAVLISIYGGPNAGEVMDSWKISDNQQWLAKDGLIQVMMDHRGSGHFGKEGINYMYHDLGKWEITDYSSMAKWLIANGNADPSKICLVGFSYGGYITALGLTYGAKVFTHGMAGGTVADWSLYDTHYAERFMGTMEDNPEGYKRSSVLTYTDKYKGILQIVHGVMDDNVHMQNSLQLISKLQDEQKDFEFMAYSGGRHGWASIPSKFNHFQNLKTKFIYKYLLEKEVPKVLLK